MTIDKIKHYLRPEIFNFWANCNDIAVIKKAQNLLKYELDNNILPRDINYIAKLNLLTYLIN